ncbi:MAG: GntR family transcriptional regulator [Anaerolinea sp.]|nr:GntR family transcriptional regulator [Anaerolinea sp.]
MNQTHLHRREIRLSSLADQVYEHLRLAIISAQLPPAEKLIELDIARQMNTSQGPVREALQRLEHDGLVERKARSATYVSSVASDEMYELSVVRANIEMFAVRRAAQKITPEQCGLLDELIAKMQTAGTANDLLSLSEFDMEFHRSIVGWSGSRALLQVWNPLSHQIQRFIVQSHPLYSPDYVEVATRHLPIVDALRQHDAESAARAVHDHIMLIWPKINP